MVDARVVRTRAALHTSIVQLASEKPVPRITISELAQHAGVNRMTFYTHFRTPAETLGSALSADYDVIRARFIRSTSQLSSPPPQLLDDTIAEILDHIDDHRVLYRLAFDHPADGTVPNLLADHFTVSVRLYLEQRRLWPPPPPPFDIDVVSRFLAHGMVGAVTTWVLNGLDDREAFMRTIHTVTPVWWHPAEP